MQFDDYILTFSGEIYRQRHTDSATLAPEAIAACRRAIAGGDAEAAPTGCPLTAKWTTEPIGCLTLHAADQPLCTSVFCRTEEDDAHLRELNRHLLLPLAREFGVEPDPSWPDLILDYPCVVTLPLPIPLPHEHMVAGDLIQCWAAAWFEESAGA